METIPRRKSICTKNENGPTLRHKSQAGNQNKNFIDHTLSNSNQKFHPNTTGSLTVKFPKGLPKNTVGLLSGKLRRKGCKTFLDSENVHHERHCQELGGRHASQGLIPGHIWSRILACGERSLCLERI